MNSLNQAQNLNRVAIVLSFVGIFIAGTLSWSHMVQQIPPCGTAGGCTTVLTSQFSSVFNVPVAYIGLAAYLALAGICVARGMMAGGDWAKQVKIGFFISLLGTLASFAFTFISLALLQELCLWCAGSAATMTLIFLVHAFMWTAAAPETAGKFDLPVVSGAAVMAVALMGISIANFQAGGRQTTVVAAEGITRETLVPKLPGRVIGNPDAKVLLIEFADPNCGACRAAHSQVKNIIRPYGARLGYIFRTLPLHQIPGHETSIPISLVMNHAAEKGKFRQFFDAVFDSGATERIKEKGNIAVIAGEVGLDRETVQNMLDKVDEAAAREQERYVGLVAEDMGLAKSMGITSTPTFIVYADGQPIKNVPGHQLEATLKSEPYASLLKE